jgi:hypothetical protein
MDGGLLLSPKSEFKKILVSLRLLKPYNIGTHLKGFETSFQVVPLFLSLFEIFSKYLQSLKGFKGLHGCHVFEAISIAVGPRPVASNLQNLDF